MIADGIAVRGRARGGVLGKDAKSSSPPPEPLRFDPDTGEVFRPSGEYDPVVARLERFELQSAAARILPGSRTANCLNAFIPVKGGSFVSPELWRSDEHGTCHYRKLQVCDSVWACPVCAAKISERRRAELLYAILKHEADGGEVLLLTLTNPHYLGDKLSDVLAGQKLALVYFNGGKGAAKLYQSIGYVGQVRALEVTHGRLRAVNNGWHPHYHILLFVRSGLDLVALRQAFYDRWAKSCAKAGLPVPSFEHGLSLESGSKAASYASKWGLESEMTKGHVKRAKHGETPFDLLRAFSRDGDRQAAALFREFAEAFKGKRQLFWSPGLKARFGVEEQSDAEIAARQDESASLLVSFEPEDWIRVRKLGLRGEVEVLGCYGREPVERLLSDLRKIVTVKKNETG